MIKFKFRSFFSLLLSAPRVLLFSPPPVSGARRSEISNNKVHTDLVRDSARASARHERRAAVKPHLQSCNRSNSHGGAGGRGGRAIYPDVLADENVMFFD